MGSRSIKLIAIKMKLHCLNIAALSQNKLLTQTANEVEIKTIQMIEEATG